MSDKAALFSGVVCPNPFSVLDEGSDGVAP